ncbi:MAG: amidohydrolase family protein [Anaerolineae bacterium]
MIIDAHNHPDWHGHDLSAFLENMASCHIDKTWLLSWEAPEDEYDPVPSYSYTSLRGDGGPIPFARCLHYKEQAPERFVLGYAPDPRRPDALDRLRAAVEIYGVELCGELKLRMMYDSPDALRMFRYCGELGLPVTVHLDYPLDTGRAYPRPNWWYGGGMEAFERAVYACPETVFIGHGPGFWAHISADDRFDQVAYPEGKIVGEGKVVEVLRRYPNLCADLSANSGLNALTRDPGFAKGFLLEFSDRLLHGRDCFDDQREVLLRSLGLPDRVLERIFAGNALELAARE